MYSHSASLCIFEYLLSEIYKNGEFFLWICTAFSVNNIWICQRTETPATPLCGLTGKLPSSEKKIHLCFVFVFLIWLLIQKRHSPLFYHTSSLLWEFSVRDLAQVLVLKCFLTDWQIAYNNAGISAFSYLNLSAFFRSCFSVFPFYHETNMQD